MRDKETERPDTLWVSLEGENIPIRYKDPIEEKLLIDDRLVVQNHPDSLAAEQFRVLCTKLTPMTLDHPSYTLAITSAVKGEGKTFTSINLALTLARDFGQKVLLVEGDMKKPTFHDYLRGGRGPGLFDVLENRASPESCWVSLCEERLRLLPAGKTTEQSTRLLFSPAMTTFIQKMREQYKYIILDSPPILPIADMNIFSQWVDGILLVVRAGKTPRSLVNRAIASLASEKIIGTVLNGVHPTLAKYYYLSYER
ncbi:MAG: CpsD/CapB family tyrosine-protein kinase [Nitrospirae bacterium]|nr:CpsD/CapB family tyrosine-protein kinase [Nitrospirota bacterium]